MPFVGAPQRPPWHAPAAHRGADAREHAAEPSKNRLYARFAEKLRLAAQPFPRVAQT